MKNRKHRKKNVIPGFGLGFGITMTWISLIVLIPLLALVFQTFTLSPSEFLAVITRRRVISSFAVSISCSVIAALINLASGVLLAWVLVRYDFPGKRIMDGLIELPFALPTAIAGITLTSLTAPTGWIGRIFEPLGIHIAYTRLGIIVALIFVGIPFVVRSVQPVLEKVDSSCEESAFLLGAGNKRIFWKVIWPEIRPAALTGFGMALARGLGEYGSVVFIAGNKPFSTEIVPLMIMSQLQEFDYDEAAAIAVIMLLLAFIILLAMNIIQVRSEKYHKTGGKTK